MADTVLRALVHRDPDKAFAILAIDNQRVLHDLHVDVAVRRVQRLQEGLGHVAVALHVVEHAAEEEVVQDHGAGMAPQQREHVLVRIRIAEVVQHPVVGRAVA